MNAVSSYSRAEATQDGFLVDVSELAKEQGIKYPTAVTRRVWDEVITPTASAKKKGQSETGRLWDVLTMFRVHASRGSGASLSFRVLVSGKYRMLSALCGPGDTREPVITILMPDED